MADQELLSMARMQLLRERVEEADYCHLGRWGGRAIDDTIDVQYDLEALLIENADLRKTVKMAYDVLNPSRPSKAKRGMGWILALAGEFRQAFAILHKAVVRERSRT